MTSLLSKHRCSEEAVVNVYQSAADVLYVLITSQRCLPKRSAAKSMPSGSKVATSIETPLEWTFASYPPNEDQHSEQIIARPIQLKDEHSVQRL